MTERRVRPRDDGIEVVLPVVERDLLRSLPDQLRQVLDGSVDAPETRARLFPRAYDDAELESEYREMAGAQLEEERLAALDAFAASLEAGEGAGDTWRCRLDEDGAVAWIGVVQDARVALGALLGIQEEDDWERVEPEEPTTALLHYLSWLHEAVLAAVRGRELE